MKFTTEDGKVWEWCGEYRVPAKDELYLTADGGVANFSWGCLGEVRAIVHPFRPQHVFGGVVFEETGEVRVASSGEFRLEAEGTVYAQNNCSSYGKYIILQPVRLVGDEEAQ